MDNHGLKFTDHGAHVLSAETSKGDLFYLSSAARLGSASPIRGGVPIIAPWFGPFLKGDPKHGWARTSQWNTTLTDAGFAAELEQDGLVLGYQASLEDDVLTLRLTMQNTTDESRMVQFALHPYFAVSDVRDIKVSGCAGESVLDRVDGKRETAGEAFTFDGELLDSIVEEGVAEVTIEDAERTLSLRMRGHDSIVVWNPGEREADKLEDVGPKEWSAFVCVEPAVLGAEQQGTQLSPGEINELTLEVSVQ
ncbi:D-hexose-6-phosphate mutarotase [Corynebacterium tapiri]|uniref:glucose-6-phosphate 1-epimerase n=1 Tax=Corynebacterium tapiri TaxID=1448266 RepID=A0A5C4U2D5_9CORY|nr:D-hexose-6-phosphate mutarotase [Corynebacterium tapiri]TNL96618.1 D-hexose-6-phosphate mutarotase [Corynebacterium tapiri]